MAKPRLSIILNNRGYSTEREILEGPFNDVHEWQYEKVCDLIGGGRGLAREHTREFEQSLAAAFADHSQLHRPERALKPQRSIARHGAIGEAARERSFQRISHRENPPLLPAFPYTPTDISSEFERISREEMTSVSAVWP